MKGKAAADPKSFAAQHSIHTNFCPHGNWYFLPWHRAYLAAFEAICADVLEDPTFALPYWDWTEDRTLPPAMAEPMFDGQSNHLFNNTRFMKATTTLSESLARFDLDAELIFGRAKINTILDSTTFQTFGSLKPRGQNDTSKQWQRRSGGKSALEREPHDFCHGGVDGDMADVNTSPRDPIFYLHHCNLDRIWARWNASDKQNDSDPLWQGFTFEQNFWDTSNKLIDVKVSSLFDTLSLGYRYDNVPTPVVAMAEAVRTATQGRFETIASAEINAEAELNTATGLPVKVSSGAPEAKALDVNQTLLPESTRNRVFAFINEISFPDSKKIGVRVFINHPNLTPATPSDDPHYAGAFTFFGGDQSGEAGAHGAPHTQSVAVDITDTLDAVRRAGTKVDNEIVVQLLPIGFEVPPEEGRFAIGSVDIAELST
jgi:tyrosinase